MRGRILYGISKSDNTDHIIKEVNEQLKKEMTSSLYIIVPDQYSSMYEEEIVKHSLEKGLMRLEVTSFKRLASKIFVRTLQKRNNYLDNAGKSIIVYQLLNTFYDQLEVFKKASNYPSFSIQVMEMIKEFKRYEITTFTLHELAVKQKNRLLSQKLSELALIYEQYDLTIQKNSFYDSDDDLSVLAKIIRNHDILDHSMIWLDKFNGFTSQEYSCISAMLKKCEQVSVCLYTSSLTDINLTNVFYPVLETYESLQKIAEDENHMLEEISIPGKDRRNEELAYLSRHYFSYGECSFLGEPEHISVYRSSGIYDEVKQVAMKISRLVRDENYRYRDIVVGCSLPDEYGNYIEAVFKSYGIPYFLSQKRPLEKHSLIGYIMAVLRIYDEKYSFNSVFAALKSPYSDFTREEVSLFENYVLEWDLKGVSTYNSEWTYRKNNSINENDRIIKVNQTRVKLISQMNHFFENIKYRSTAKEFLTALYDFLMENKVYEKLQGMMEQARSQTLDDYADEIKQSWNMIITAFSQINHVLNEQKYTTSHFIDILNITFKSYEIGVIPPSNDKVEVGNMTRTCSLQKKVYFIMAANEPSFPSDILNSGLLTDGDRVTLSENGLKLAADSYNQVIEQRLTIFEAISVVTDKIQIGYSISDLSHKAKRPANIIERIKNIFVDLKEESSYSYEDSDFIYTPLMGMEYLKKNSEMSDLLLKWYSEHQYDLFITLQEGIHDYVISDEEAATLLYGDTLDVSVSKLEAYSKCPFAFFAEYGLKAKERDIFDIKPPDIGSIIHDILGHLLKNNITEKEAIISESKKVFLEKTANTDVFRRNSRHLFLGERILDRVAFSYEEILKQIEKSGFIPKDYEVSFGVNKKLNPIIMQSDSGKTIMLQGRIDRVDEALVNGHEVFRIIDYKLSDKQLKLYKIKEGTEIQLAVYLYAYSKNTKAIPGGMYYFSTFKPVIKTEGLANKEDLMEEIHKETKLEGYTVDDESILEISHAYSDKKRISDEKLSNMFLYLNEYVVKKTEEIYKLENSPVPVKEDNFVQCSYCQFLSVCGFDINKYGYHYKTIKSQPDEEVEFK
ncbi:MAG: exodeoxyribonuclease V subunit gamma [Clostridia bacterium]|nr:exodeoxyribonuclease V subunit gamma [Clostridia bacterium]